MDTLGNSQGSSRLLQVREGRCLIGVTGEIGEVIIPFRKF